MPRQSLSKVIESLRREGAELFNPADMVGLKRTDAELAELGLAPLPMGYRTFLGISDGLDFDGLRLHGTRAHEREVDAATLKLPSLGGFLTERQVTGWTPDNRIIPVGRTEIDLIVLDPASDQVIACDPYSSEEYERWDDLASFLATLL